MEKITKKSPNPKKSKEKQKNESQKTSSSKKKIKSLKKIKTSSNGPIILSIYLGTYEGKLLVNNINIKTKENDSNFSFSSSQNAIRTIYHKSNSLFVSGTDEVIHMYNIHKKLSEGDLVTYSGSVNDIKIHDNYLIVAGENNTIPIWRMSDFNNIIELKGHKKAINSIDIHSSGGFLVSGGRDNCVIIFDLLTGRKIEKFEFDYICNKVELFDKDKFLMVVFDLHIFILDLMKSGNQSGNDNVIQKLNFTKKIINAYIVKNKMVIVFTDGEIKTYELNIKEDENNNDKNEEKKEDEDEKEENEENNKEEKEEDEDKNIVKIKLIKKYGKIEYTIPGKITSLDSELTRK